MPIILIILLNLALVSSWAKQPEIMALERYENQSIAGWLVSEKLDGVRAYWDGQNLISRGGNHLATPAWFTQDFPPFALDGELWIGREQFEATLSVVMTQTPHDGWKKVGYHIFDVPQASGGLMARLGVLENYLTEHDIPHLNIIPQVTISSAEQLQARLEKEVKNGAEGLVVRDPNVGYQVGRSHDSLKVKPKYDAECKVIGYTEGQGKYTGKVGALICLNAQNQHLKLGSGLTDQLRDNPPKIGSQVTYQYSGYTQKGWPRHAVYYRQRSHE
ncbi:MAG: DNA ligase [Thiomicrospira sp.]|uniref:DNA ligase n=1 Tax=Thiomicrospira sp. TaxID=935 RepID=UPI0019FFB659|nr:DNA ligase [Thiomicrospira sp.]MBE0493441.1 DNA ligase [Thiomicrospira sp.]